MKLTSGSNLLYPQMLFKPKVLKGLQFALRLYIMFSLKAYFGHVPLYERSQNALRSNHICILQVKLINSVTLS